MATIDELLTCFKKLPEYLIEVGVFTEENGREEKQTVKAKLTNAEILFINENGSPVRNIPARPVLQKTVEWANKNLLDSTYSRCIEKYINSDFDEKEVEKELEIMCMEMENYAKELISSNDGTFKPNAKSTIKKKGFDHPLFQTGQLAKAITCRLIKL